MGEIDLSSEIRYSHKPNYYEKIDKKNKKILELIKASQVGKHEMARILVNERPDVSYDEVLASRWVQNAIHNYLQFIDFELEAMICYSLEEELIERLDIKTIDWLAKEAEDIEPSLYKWFQNDMAELYLDAAIDWSYPENMLGGLPHINRHLRITLLEQVNDFILYAECDNDRKYFISTRKGSPLLLNIHDHQDFLKCCNSFVYIQQ